MTRIDLTKARLAAASAPIDSARAVFTGRVRRVNVTLHRRATQRFYHLTQVFRPGQGLVRTGHAAIAESMTEFSSLVPVPPLALRLRPL